MSAINLPYNIQNGQPLDADQVMANLLAISAMSNGLLEADINVRVAAPPASNVGASNDEGTSAYLSRADHAHVIQGVEQVTTLPTSDNFLGRLVYVTAGANIGKLMMCIDASAPTFLGFGNMSATDLPVHAAQHADGAHDPLPDNVLSDHMKAARTLQSVANVGTSADFSTASWTDLASLATVTSTGIQTLLVWVQGRVKNSNGSANWFKLRVVDVTAANVVIWEGGLTDLANGNSIEVAVSFPYTTPAAGTRTLKLQGQANLANMNLMAQAGSTEKILQTAVL